MVQVIEIVCQPYFRVTAEPITKTKSIPAGTATSKPSPGKVKSVTSAPSTLTKKKNSYRGLIKVFEDKRKDVVKSIEFKVKVF